jgi:hypothetical protein
LTRSSGALRTSRLVAAGLLAATAIAWAVPSDVVGMVVRQDEVLLGRYSEAHLVELVLWTLLALPSAAMLALGTRPLEVIGRMVLATLACIVGFAAVSIGSRVSIKPRYLETPVAELVPAPEVPLAGTTRRRQPDQVFHMRRKDRPGPARSYPNAPPGFPTAKVTLTTDSDGFRNVDPCDPCDVVVVGDSFTEGSMVSDDEVWTTLYAREVGVSVANLAVSGASPDQYLNNLAAFGIAKHPARVIVTVYEGNDFKRRRTPEPEPPGGPSLGERLRELRRDAFKDSPLRARIKMWMFRNLGPIHSDAKLPDAPALSWMPAVIGEGEGAHAYAFEPRRMMRLYWEEGKFRKSPHWTTNAEIFTRIDELTKLHGSRLLMVYVPSKPHVVLPLLRDHLDPNALRAFASYDEHDLPPADEFSTELFERLDSQERVFLEYCDARGIPCLSLTEPLRAAVAAGVPAYFTYDPHWTREGHVVAAREVAAAAR